MLSFPKEETKPFRVQNELTETGSRSRIAPAVGQDLDPSCKGCGVRKMQLKVRGPCVQRSDAETRRWTPQPKNISLETPVDTSTRQNSTWQMASFRCHGMADGAPLGTHPIRTCPTARAVQVLAEQVVTLSESVMPLAASD